MLFRSLLKNCSLPLTAKEKVNLIVTDMAVIEIKDKRMHLIEIAEGLTVEDVIKATEPELVLPKEIKYFSI